VNVQRIGESGAPAQADNLTVADIAYAFAVIRQLLLSELPNSPIPSAGVNGGLTRAQSQQPSGPDSEPVGKPRRKRKLPRYLNPDEIAALRKAAEADQYRKRDHNHKLTGLRNRAMFELWYRAGLRISEVSNLEPRDVNIAEGEIRVIDGKGGDRVCYFDKAIVAPLLEQWKRERKAHGLGGARTLFCTVVPTTTAKGGHQEPGRPVNPRTLQLWLKRIAAAAGLDPSKVTPHKLRHTWATEYYREQRDIIQVQEQLGHKDLETTMVYTKLVDGVRKAGIQARKDPLA